MNLPSLPRLYYFYRTALRKSISLTAKELFISQPALSIQIRELEKDLGCQLFWRQSKRSLILTGEGETLLETCRGVFDKLESTMTQLQQGKVQGDLILNVSQSFGSYVLLPLLKKFQQEYPLIKTQIYLTDDVVDLKLDRTDIAIRWGKPDDESLVAVRLMDVSICVVSSKDYLQRSAKIKTPMDLSDHAIISRGGVGMGWVPWLDTLPKGSRPQLRDHLIIDSFVAQLEAVRSGMGVALLPDYLIDYANKQKSSVVVLPLPKITFPIYLCYLKTDFLPAKIQCFSKFLRENLR